MKTVDIRKVLVGSIAKQSKVSRVVESPNLPCSISCPTWDYDKGSAHKGLFIRVLGGFKHISTGKIYPKATRFTGGKTVINPESIKGFAQKHPSVIARLFEIQRSYHVSVDAIKEVEQTLFSENNSLQM